MSTLRDLSSMKLQRLNCLSFYDFLNESIKRRNTTKELSLSALKNNLKQSTVGFRGGFEIECFFPIDHDEWFFALKNNREMCSYLETLLLNSAKHSYLSMTIFEILNNKSIQRLAKKYASIQVSYDDIKHLLRLFLITRDMNEDTLNQVIEDIPNEKLAKLGKNKKEFPDITDLTNFAIYQGIFSIIEFHKIINKFSLSRDYVKFFFNIVQDKLKSSAHISTKVYSSYNDDKDYSHWSLSPDGSLFSSSLYDIKQQSLKVPVEIVSPVIEAEDIESSLMHVFKLLNHFNCEVNDSTGFHFSFSATHVNKHQLKHINWGVFLLRFFEVQVLKSFNRLDNIYTKSVLAAIKKTREGSYTNSGHYIHQGLYGHNVTKSQSTDFKDWVKQKGKIQPSSSQISSVSDEPSEDDFKKAKENFAKHREINWKQLGELLIDVLTFQPWTIMMEDDDFNIILDREYSINFSHMNSDNWRIEVRAMGGVNYLQKAKEINMIILRIFEAFNFASIPLNELLSKKENVYFLYHRINSITQILDPVIDDIGVSRPKHVEKIRETKYYKTIKEVFNEIESISTTKIVNEEAKKVVQFLKKEIMRFKLKFLTAKNAQVVMGIKKFIPMMAGEKALIDDMIYETMRVHPLIPQDKEQLETIRLLLIKHVKQIILLTNTWFSFSEVKKRENRERLNQDA